MVGLGGGPTTILVHIHPITGYNSRIFVGQTVFNDPFHVGTHYMFLFIDACKLGYPLFLYL